MLQFQSLGTLAATSTLCGGVTPGAGGVLMGVVSMLGGPAKGVAGPSVMALDETVDAELWLPLRLWNDLVASKHRPQAREGSARGLKLASWSSGSA